MHHKNVAFLAKNYFIGQMGYLIYFHINHKTYCGGFNGTYTAVLKCHI
jgi:hypothetical protein